MLRLSKVFLLLALAGCAASPAVDRRQPPHVEGFSGDVLLRTEGHRVFVLVDTQGDGARDGLVDQWFVLQTSEPTPPLFEHVGPATILHAPGRLRVSTEARQIDVAVHGADEAWEASSASPATRLAGVGLAHTRRRTNIAIGEQRPDAAWSALETASGAASTCQAGGEGAISASIGSGDSSCSITCAAGYYACCNRPSHCWCVRG